MVVVRGLLLFGVGCLLFDACRLWLVGRCLSLFVFSCSLFVVGCWLSNVVVCCLRCFVFRSAVAASRLCLFVRCSFFVLRRVLLVVCWLLWLVVCRVLFVVRCVLRVVCCLVVVWICCLWFVASCLRCAVRCLLFVACCLWFVVCCSLFGVDW